MLFRLRLALTVSGALLLVTAAACGPEQAANPPFNRDGGPDFSAFGLPCPKAPPDTDGDGISDEHEGGLESPPRDTDGDGIPDFRDLDSDNDGIPDFIEGRNGNACTPPADSDNDGIPDFRDLDSDDASDATLPDSLEAGPNTGEPLDSDGDGMPDYMDPDDDNDGIPDIIEMTKTGSLKPAKTAAEAPDTDGDGIPDYLDLDSDNDTIADKTERYSDIDGDGIPNYRDDDSDGDCIADAIEAGDDNLSTDPLDSDGDGVPDFADVDSDNDGLRDGDEDKNCDGLLGDCETNRVNTDTDGDGVPDLVEIEACLIKPVLVQHQTMCSCDGNDSNVTPQTRGDFVFVVDYNKAPSPNVGVVSLSTTIGQTDVVMTVDTSSTMGPVLNGLTMGWSTLAAGLIAKIPNTAFGLFEFRDLGLPQNDASSTPPSFPSFRYAQRLQTVTGAGLAAMQNAIMALQPLGGGDDPDAGWGALWTLVNAGTRVISTTGSSTYTLNTNPNILPLSMGEAGGNGLGAGLRPGSLPVFVSVTDSEWHDGPGSLMVADAESGLDAYPSTACNPCTNAPTRRETITALQNIGARLIGLVAIDASTTGDPKTRAIKAAQETGALVDPADFGPVSIRPAACAIDKCCTGVGGAAESSQAGQCPLAFSIDGTTGADVTSAINSGVLALANNVRYDVHVEASDVDPTTVDNFVQSLDPDLTGTGAATMCLTMATAPLQDKYIGPHAVAGEDTHLDTYPGLRGGSFVCFDVQPKMNTTVMPTDKPQIFRAQVQLKGVQGSNAAVNLGVARQIYFLVPPSIPTKPIP